MTGRQVQALVTALATCLATLAAFILHLDDPWWAAISAWIIGHPEKRFVFQKGLLRVVGTLAGCLLGYLVAISTGGWVLIQLIVMVFAFGTAVFMRFTAEHAYAWAMFWVILALTVLISQQNPAGVADFAYFRSIEIVTGVIVATLVAIVAEAWRPDEGDAEHDAHQETAVERKNAAYAAGFGGFAMLLVLLLWQIFNLPSMVQIIISLFTAMAPSLVQMHRQISMRLSGCLVGGTLGVIVTGFGIETLWIWMVLLFIGIYAASLLHHSETAQSYIGTQAGIAFLICMVAESGPQQSILPVVDRAAGITLAYVVLACLLILVEPWVRERPDQRLQEE